MLACWHARIASRLGRLTRYVYTYTCTGMICIYLHTYAHVLMCLCAWLHGTYIHASLHVYKHYIHIFIQLLCFVCLICWSVCILHYACSACSACSGIVFEWAWNPSNVICRDRSNGVRLCLQIAHRTVRQTLIETQACESIDLPTCQPSFHYCTLENPPSLGDCSRTIARHMPARHGFGGKSR